MEETRHFTTENLVHWLPFAKDLPQEETQQLLQALHLRQFPPNAFLFHEGDAGDRLFLVVNGEVEIIKSVGEAEERRLSLLKAGDLFGEMSLLLPMRQRYASARTLKPTILVEMLHKDFQALVQRQPQLGFYILQEMTIRWNKTEQGIIAELQEKNQQLVQAYEELKQAQARLVERERIEHELSLAKKIQQGILPSEIPTTPGWQISVHWQPAHAVGGDFYDFISFPNNILGIMIGDATGKGIPAALVMATTCSILRAIATGLAQEGLPSPGEILSKANDLLCQQMPPGMFITCLIAVLDPESGNLVYANAGHCLPFHLMAQGAEELRATGMPLGLLPGMSYDDQQSKIEWGENLVMFSDGLLEAHNPMREILGAPGLYQILTTQDSNFDLIQLILERLAEFTGPGWEQEDDLTLLSVQRISKTSN